jgi:hypothetical protein
MVEIILMPIVLVLGTILLATITTRIFDRIYNKTSTLDQILMIFIIYIIIETVVINI